MSAILIDTNLLIYAYDQNNPVKQAQAIRVLKQLQETQQGLVSVQSLSEFINAGTRKLRPPLTPAEALSYVERMTHTYRILDLTPQVVLEAARGVRDHQLAYYDAQLWAIARLNQIPVIFSEDFNVGAVLGGVRFVNPFAEGFAVEEWI